MHEVANNRIALEKAILIAANSIREDERTECLDRQSVEAFLTGWHQLVTYYERIDDSTISVEVVREYLDWLNRFSTVWHNEQRSLDCREMAQEACEELELSMDDIIKAVDSRLYPTGR